MAITASMVKELRERTGAGMMECKKALQAANGDMETAITEMRKRGQAKAAKRATKVAAEGAVLIEISDDKKTGSMIEVNCETDFVARDENFTGFAKVLAQKALASKETEVDALMAQTNDAGETFEHARQELVTKIGENIKLRRIASLESTGIVGSYNHGARIGVLVAISKDNDALAKDVAMHIAASNPQAIDENGVDAELIAKEKEIFAAQAAESGKPADIIEKMVTGRIAKYLKEICLVSQPFVKNPDQTVGALLKESEAEVLAFVRFEVGEGIEKEEVDFAEEVKAQVQGSA